MAMDFPTSPSVNQVFGAFKWDGEKWVSFNAADMLLTGNQTVTGGYNFTPPNAGNFTNGQTFTPNPLLHNFQVATNQSTAGQSVAIAPPTVDCAIEILWMNNAGVNGSVSFTGGWSVAVANIGDIIGTGAGLKYLISMRRISGTATYAVRALQ